MHIFMTGATGQVGAFVAGELLKKGHNLSLLVRGPNAQERIQKIFEKIGILSTCWKVWEGDLFSLPTSIRDIDIVLHSAAELSFDPSQKEHIWHVNLDGTKNILSWAYNSGVKFFQYVSTAYIAGRYDGNYDEECMDLGQSFRNDYEASKMACEKFCHEFCKTKGMGLKIYRPGIIMGTSEGKSLRYQGYYVFLKVLSELCDKYKKQINPAEGIHYVDNKIHIPIRVEANPTGKKHLVPLDYVAQSITAMLPLLDRTPETIFLLPQYAPTNQETMEWTQKALGLCGLSLEKSLDKTSLNRMERLIQHYIHIYRPYLQEEPNFQYHTSIKKLESAGIFAPTMDADYFFRLISYGKEDKWGYKEKETQKPSIQYPYFTGFLPTFVGKLFLSGKITSCFAVSINGDEKGFWKLTLDQGVLKSLGYTNDRTTLNFMYRLSQETFQSIVSGKLDPRHAFFTGKTDISGDIEHGLKVATVLSKFFRENPYIHP